jgi:hypothetical protein
LSNHALDFDRLSLSTIQLAEVITTVGATEGDILREKVRNLENFSDVGPPYFSFFHPPRSHL